jgi:hypothetical protein
MSSPYAQYSNSIEVVSNYLLTLLQSNATALSVDPTRGFLYGDQSGLLPVTPMLCVVPGPRTSSYNGIGGRPVLSTFQTFVMVYYGKLQDLQQNVHASLTLANQVENVVNADPTLGGHAIDCLCSDQTPGVSMKGGALVDTTRMVFRTRAKVALNP